MLPLDSYFKAKMHEIRFRLVWCAAPDPTGVAWLRGTAVERRSLAGELSLSSARPLADG